jgi:hypothetical protein
VQGSDACLVPDMGQGAGDDGQSGGHREAKVLRYKEKRANRLFSKKIRYEVRKLNAERRPRMKVSYINFTFLSPCNVSVNPRLPLYAKRNYVVTATVVLIVSIVYEFAGSVCEADRRVVTRRVVGAWPSGNGDNRILGPPCIELLENWAVCVV